MIVFILIKLKYNFLSMLFQTIRRSGSTWDLVFVVGQIFVGERGCDQHGERKRKELLRDPPNTQKQFGMLLLLSLSDDVWTGK